MSNFHINMSKNWHGDCLKCNKKHAEVRPGVEEDSHGNEVIPIVKCQIVTSSRAINIKKNIRTNSFLDL